MPIRYREGYKYALHESYSVQTAIRPGAFIFTDFLRLDTDGVLYIKAGYAWDGPSGPAIDTKSAMRGSLVHDAGYALLREGHLPLSFRRVVDEEYRRICLEDGMWSLRAHIHFDILGAFGEAAATMEHTILTAP